MLTSAFLVFAQTTAPAGKGGPSGMETILNFLLLIVPLILVWYFLITRPQKKKDQERRSMLDKLKKGDRIVTIGGIHGEVESVKETHVIILVDTERNVTLKMTRNAIHNVLTSDSAEAEK